MTACTPKTIIAYWLIPAEPARGFFASTIAELAARFDAPLFEPHMTIYMAGTGEDIPADVLKHALTDCNPFRLSVRNIQYSDGFTKTVFVQFEPRSLLSEISHAFQEASTLPDEYQFDPHLSLLYKTMTRSAKIDVAASVSLPFTEVLFDSAKAVICPTPIRSRQDVETWRVVASQTLVQ